MVWYAWVILGVSAAAIVTLIIILLTRKKYIKPNTSNIVLNISFRGKKKFIKSAINEINIHPKIDV